MSLPSLVIRGRESLSVVPGGMGVGITHVPFVLEAAACGAWGILSSAWMPYLYYLETGKWVKVGEAVKYFVRRAKESAGKGRLIGINIMSALSGFKESVAAAIEANVDGIFMGAGLPLSAPEIAGDANVALVPIVSGARSARNIGKRWERYNRRPDGFVLAGNKTAGHSGYKANQINDSDYNMENVLPEVLEVAEEYGNIPVIVAGGLTCHEDIQYWHARGASGAQFGSLFLMTHESGALPWVKERIARCSEDDVVVAHPDLGLRGSPAGYPFRVLNDSPGLSKIPKAANCKGCPILQKPCGEGKGCLALDYPEKAFCIVRGLRGVIHPGMEEDAIITVGANAGKINDIVSVKERFQQLGAIA